MDPLYTVELFGGLRVVAHFDTLGESAARTVTRFRTHQTGSLLAYLACNAGRVLSREVLIDMLWPDACPKSGRSRLSMALSSLRSQLEPPGIAAGSVLNTDQHRIGLSRLVTTDTAQFEALIDSAERPSCRGDERRPMLEKAVRLFHRDLAPGHYDSWILAEQERLADRARKALLALARTAASEGDVDTAIAFARRAVAECDGLCDDADALLEQLGAGGRSPAFAAESRVRQVPSVPISGGVGEQVGQFAPKISTANAVMDSDNLPNLKSASPAASANSSASAPVLPVPLTRFFGREAELQALTDAVADSRIRLITLSGAGGAGKSRLVREAALRWRALSSDEELDMGSEALYLPKTPDMVAVDFTSETEAFRLPIRVAAALNLLAADVSPFETTDEDIALAPFIRVFAEKKNPVLILDNIEQLLPEGSEWLEALLERVPHLTSVVTSRVRLKIPGEHEITVRPLSAPPLAPRRRVGTASVSDTLTDYLNEFGASPRPDKLLRDWPSVALFVDRAQAARPGFALTKHNADDIVDLVCHLEGLPLSIELAAARAQVMTPAHMLRQLHDDRFDLLTSRGSGATGRRKRAGRHTSLRETVAWSVSLLPEEIQTFYAQMSVFRGGWDDEAAEAVSDNPMALDALAVLCDASLVCADASLVENDEVIRFDMLESLREFAATLLNTKQEVSEPLEPEEAHPAYAAAATRHSEFFADTVAQCAPQLQAADAKSSLEILSRENDNIKAALNWAMAQKTSEMTQLALTLGGNLGPYWSRTGRLHEGRYLLKATMTRSLRKSLASARAEVVAPKLARAVNCLGVLAMQQRDYKDAGRWFRTALFLERNEASASLDLAVGDPVRTQYLRRRASVLNNFAIVKRQLHDSAGAARAYMDSLTLWRELGENRFVGIVLSNLGAIAGDVGNWEMSAKYLREAIVILRAAKNPNGEAAALNNLAEVSYRLGRLAEADGIYRQSLRIFHLQNDVPNSAKNLFQLALVQVQQDQALGHTIDRGVRMLQIAWLVLLEDGVALSETDIAAASRLVGGSWMRPTEDFGDLRVSLNSLITALLGENRFASASLATRASTGAINDPNRVGST